MSKQNGHFKALCFVEVCYEAIDNWNIRIAERFGSSLRDCGDKGEWRWKLTEDVLRGAEG